MQGEQVAGLVLGQAPAVASTSSLPVAVLQHCLAAGQRSSGAWAKQKRAHCSGQSWGQQQGSAARVAWLMILRGRGLAGGRVGRGEQRAHRAEWEEQARQGDEREVQRPAVLERIGYVVGQVGW